MKKRIAVISLFVALAALLLATVPAASPAYTLSTFEKGLVQAVNRQRVKHGLVRVRVHAKLVVAAQGHSTDMAQQQYFAHNSATGEVWSSRLVRYGYTNVGFTYWKTGENIYKTSGLYAAFPQTAVKAWMKSPMHRQVILTRRFRDIGVGAVMCDGTKYLTLDLGRRIK